MEPMRWLVAPLLFLTLPAWAAWNGSIGLSGQAYQDVLSPDTKTWNGVGDIQLKNRGGLWGDWRYRVHAVGLYNFATAADRERVFADLPEFYLDWPAGEFKTRLGFNTHNWGVVDVYSPADTVNPTTLFDPLNPRKIGTFALETTWSHNDWQITALYIPYQRESAYPGEDSRWLPRDVLIPATGQDVQILLPPVFHYRYTDAKEFNHSRSHNAGLRLAYHLGSWDLYASVFSGVNTSPNFEITAFTTTVQSSPLILQATGDIALAPVYFRRTTGTLAVVHAAEFGITRFETAYTDAERVHFTVNPWMWQNALAFEKSFALNSATLTWLTQLYYANSYAQADNLSGSFRLFDRTALLGFRLAFSESRSGFAAVIYDDISKGYVTQMAWEEKWTDSLKSQLRLDLIDGQQGLLRTYRGNDRATVDVTYVW